MKVWQLLKFLWHGEEQRLVVRKRGCRYDEVNVSTGCVAAGVPVWHLFASCACTPLFVLCCFACDGELPLTSTGSTVSHWTALLGQ